MAEEWTFDLFGGTPTVSGPLFQAPLLQFSMHIGAVVLGIAEGAIGDLVASVSGDRRRLYARKHLADSPNFQALLGRTDAAALAPGTGSPLQPSPLKQHRHSTPLARRPARTIRTTWSVRRPAPRMISVSPGIRSFIRVSITGCS